MAKHMVKFHPNFHPNNICQKYLNIYGQTLAKESGERVLEERTEENKNICIYTISLTLYKYKQILYICICIKVRESEREESDEREFEKER